MRGVAKRRSDFPLSKRQRAVARQALYIAIADYDELLRRHKDEAGQPMRVLLDIIEGGLPAMRKLHAELEAFDDLKIVRKSFQVPS